MNCENDLYKIVKDFVLEQRTNNRSRDQIINLSFLGCHDFNSNFNVLLSVHPLLKKIKIFDEWKYYVETALEDISENGVPGTIEQNDSIIVSTNPDNELKIYENEGSSWHAYEEKLFKKGFSKLEIDRIKDSAFDILQKLSLDTSSSDPIKGLVIGNVQSGKTANMAALCAMAADNGFNLFIVLSGVIENLRRQTLDRLLSDLNSNGNLIWESIDNFKGTRGYTFRNINLHPRVRYLTVCLKNKSRLKDLLNWLASDEKNRAKLKILLIDDEADQAGIDSSKKNKKSNDIIDRTAINKMLVNLFINNNGIGKKCDTRFKALNYVAYTATPYANVLNESPGLESTYPESFVACIPLSNKYFGPQRIFGLDEINYEGMNIINHVPEEDVQMIKHIDSSLSIPETLKFAISWFYCCFAIQKLRGFKKPVSMLIHTSQKIEEHDILKNKIENWIQSMDDDEFLNYCSKSYIEETSAFTKNDFYYSYKEYNNQDIKDYPSFEEIKDILLDALHQKLENISIDDENKVEFQSRIYLCVDNSSHNSIVNKKFMRLLYPEENNFITGFIVIGGTTLSRGLTIKGLVSTYFLRTVRTADTLMQMGRRFGYWDGYELLPRLRITERTHKQFIFLSKMDYHLREVLKNLQDMHISPKDVGVKIINHPDSKFLTLTSSNKMKKAIKHTYDFSGLSSQTTMFFDDDNVLNDNFNNTMQFIDTLGTPIDDHLLYNSSSNYIIRDNIDTTKVIAYIENMKFPAKEGCFSNLALLCNWLKKMAKDDSFKYWNVSIAGKQKNDNNYFKHNNLTIAKLNRSRKKDDDLSIIKIGALRNVRDWYSDIKKSDITNLSKDELNKLKCNNSNSYLEIREKCGLNKKCLLVIHFIDKDSKPRNSEINRIQMHTTWDIVGLSFVIPRGHNINNSQELIIDLNNSNDMFMSEVDNDYEN